MTFIGGLIDAAVMDSSFELEVLGIVLTTLWMTLKTAKNREDIGSVDGLGITLSPPFRIGITNPYVGRDIRTRTMSKGILDITTINFVVHNGSKSKK